MRVAPARKLQREFLPFSGSAAIPTVEIWWRTASTPRMTVAKSGTGLT